MGIRFGLGARRKRAGRDSASHNTNAADLAAQLVDSVMTGATTELELVIQAARLVVSTRLASTTLLMRRLHVTSSEADRILARLERCEVIAPAVGNKPRTVLTTTGQLPRVIEEFIARG